MKRDPVDSQSAASGPSKPELDLLSQVPLFGALPEGELAYLASTLQTQEIPAGTILFREGEYGEHFYVIMAGRLEIMKAFGQPEERVVAVREPGDFIGEMSLFNRDGLRTASVRSLVPSRLKVMTREQFDALLYRYPTLAYEMIRVLSKRLTSSHQVAMRDLQVKNQALTQAYEELKAAQEQIIAKEKLERELQLARQIQMSILPRVLPSLAGFSLGALIAPARAVGGDFYDFFPLDTDRMGIVIADVTDKGVPAAIFMGRAHALLRAEGQRDFSPVETLKALNRHLVSLNDIGMFATVLYGILDSRSGVFDYARAGHELPLLYRPDTGVERPDMKPGMPVGMLEQIPIDQNRITIPTGGCLLLHTDGVTDQSNRLKQPFELETRFSLLEQQRRDATAGAAAESPAQAICDALYAELLAFAGDVEQFDDITLVAVQKT